jgi:hypothetical protein
MHVRSFVRGRARQSLLVLIVVPFNDDPQIVRSELRRFAGDALIGRGRPGLGRRSDCEKKNC